MPSPTAAGAPCEESSHLPRHEQGRCGAVFNLLWIFHFRLHTFQFWNLHFIVSFSLL